MNRAFVIANWKLNLPAQGIESYLETFGAADRPGGISTIIAPPFPFLEGLVRKLSDWRSMTVSAQDCSSEVSGAFTGDVSAAMIRETGARFVIIGHSERRTLRGDSGEVVAQKLRRAIEAGLVPVLCIGEDLRTRDSGGTVAFLAQQICDAAVESLENADRVIVAYEPIWAIGTGRHASSAMIAATRDEINLAIRRFWPASVSEHTPVLYGGSVTRENAGEIWREGGIDGFLVGGASLDASSFLAIHDACREPHKPDPPENFEI